MKRRSQANSVRKEDRQGWGMGNDSGDSEGKRRSVNKSGYRGQSRKEREPTSSSKYRHGKESGYRGRSTKQREAKSSSKRHGKKLGYRAGIKSCLEHIAEYHMSYGKYGSKSIFKATKLCEIWSLVYRTLTCPDEVEEKSDKDRLVFKKSFNTPVGVHGFTRAKCYTVEVVYDQLKRRPITAYPTLP